MMFQLQPAWCFQTSASYSSMEWMLEFFNGSCAKTKKKKFGGSGHLIHITWRCRHYNEHSIESKTQGRRQGKILLFSNSVEQKVQRLYSEGAAIYGSVCTLVRSCKNPVQHFLLSKSSITRISRATRNFGKMKPFARFMNEIWCMELAFGCIFSESRQWLEVLAFSSRQVWQNIGCQKIEDRKLHRKLFAEVVTE